MSDTRSTEIRGTEIRGADIRGADIRGADIRGTDIRGTDLSLRRVSHRFGDAVALEDVSLDIAAGEFVVFLGPSGCGKTTLLRAIAGFVTPTEGELRIGGQRVEGLPPDQRGVGIVFQSYALFPHMTVARNVAYGLEARGIARAARTARVAEMLRFVQLEALAGRYPRQLSGGQQQRVALARVLAVDPAILLLDEPFAALDKNLRLDMQAEVKRIQRDTGITTVMVTHDQEEALSLADRIAVFHRGQLLQYGTPQEVYDAPATRFVSGFVGHANFLAGRLERSDAEGATVRLDWGGTLELPRARPCAQPGRVVVSVRPENWILSGGEGPGLPGRVCAAMPLGPTIAYELEVPSGGRLRALSMRAGRAGFSPGEAVRLTVADPARCPVFVDDPATSLNTGASA